MERGKDEAGLPGLRVGTQGATGRTGRWGKGEVKRAVGVEFFFCLVIFIWITSQDYYINMRELLGFALSKMHKVVAEEDERFAVVWVQESDHRVGPWFAWRFSESLHESYGKNLEAIHVVHPSWSVRFLRLFLWPLANDDFWDYFHSHERIEFLDVALDMRKFRLPKDIVEYDQWLDKQAEELHKQQAMKHGQGSFLGAFGSNGVDEEKKRLEEQMEEMKRVLEQKSGRSAKTD